MESQPTYITKSDLKSERGWTDQIIGTFLQEPYQPFVFNVSSNPNNKADAVWFSYYKDLRESGGSLKLGYGPGGLPALD